MSNTLPVIETILTALPPVVIAQPAPLALNQSDNWIALEERIAGWIPADGEPDVRADEDGYVQASRKAIAVALNIAARLREAGVGAPAWLVQDGNGGVNFEWHSENRAETLTVDVYGETELMKFENSKLIARKPISFAAALR